MNPRSILVTDGEERAALALVRSFGRAGHRVVVGSARPRALAAASRHASGEILLPNPLRNAKAYAIAVLEAARQQRCDTVIPLSEASLYAVLAERERFGEILIPFPTIERFRQLGDKAAVLAEAPTVGISVPRQVRLAARGDCRGGLGSIDFPVVVKPSRSVSPWGEGSVKLGVFHAADPSALHQQLDDLPEAAYPVLVQQRIVGPGIGVFLLVWEGVTRAVFAHRRIREKPPSGGVSVYRESVPLDPRLLEQCVALLAAFQWRGVAMIELKLDAISGVPFLMEINGRFWGSLQLAIDSGVDFPALLLAAAMGAPAPPVTTWRVGIRSRWWWGDVDHLLTMYRHPRADLHLSPEHPGRARTLASFLRLWWPGDRSEVLRLGDPRPFFRESAQWLRQAISK